MPSSSSKLIKELVLQPLVDFLMEQLLPLSSRWESRFKTLITSAWKLTVYQCIILSLSLFYNVSHLLNI